jgi:outer membrane immunogenic protein
MRKIALAAAAAVAITGTASAADLGAPRYRPPVTPVVPVAPVVLPFSWTGCYLGGFAGGAWANKVNIYDVNNYAGQPVVPYDSWSYSLDNSFIAGGTAGCNWQPIGTPWVFGIEGELGYIDLAGSAYDPLFPVSNALLASASIGNVYGMMTGRVGFAVDRVLFYAKGGAAFVDESVTVEHPGFPNLGIPAFSATASNNDARWTLGAGVEWAFAGNWTLKGEYMYIGSGSTSACGVAVIGAPAGPGTYCWDHNGDDGISTAKIGINYLFGGTVPLFARY